MSFTIETERLVLWPLDCNELELLLTSKQDFDEKFNCKYRGDVLTGFMAEIFAGQLVLMKKHPENYLMYTFWMMLRKEDRVIVGSADFKCPPKNARVEIGYGLTKEYEGKGYMKETVEAMCRWALEQKEIDAVVAETEKWNIRSQNVLKNCGFELESWDKTLWWVRKNG